MMGAEGLLARGLGMSVPRSAPVTSGALWVPCLAALVRISSTRAALLGLPAAGQTGLTPVICKYQVYLEQLHFKSKVEHNFGP